MPLFIAYTHDNYVEDVVLAKDLNLAMAYWQGKGVKATYTRSVLESDINDHPTGVIPLVNTQVKSIYVEGRHRDFHLINKGR